MKTSADSAARRSIFLYSYDFSLAICFHEKRVFVVRFWGNNLEETIPGDRQPKKNYKPLDANKKVQKVWHWLL